MKQISSILCMLLTSAYLVSPVYGSASADELPGKKDKSTLSTTGKATGKSSLLDSSKPKPAGAEKRSQSDLGKSVAAQNCQDRGSSAGKSAAQSKDNLDSKSKVSVPDQKGSLPDNKGSAPDKKGSGSDAKGSAQKSKGSAPAKKGYVSDSKGSAPDSKGTSTEHNSNHKKPAATGGRAMLVPPPPPSVPTMTEMGMGGMGSTMVFVGENIDYMSAADLSDLKEKTDKGIERFRKEVEEMVVAALEKQQRAASFDQLFAEGVISRRELESSKHESEKASQELADLKQSLALLEQKHIKIEQRLAFLSKAKKSVSSKHSKSRHK